ncbi:copper chaperone [Enterococcus sp. DIV2402]|jgi:copper chaperone|uniref:Copper chaperone CopZ n=1 Tax=Candidatus Enterococcus lowellii TaxID=2230877 RepID=A0ABZ2SQN9_9ENTE|nr:copper chaperone CopZ [Enterococcus sp. DIV2402]MBO0465003.1 copper chaperone CopZ [Enterococcus sp. DIV2402]
MKQKFAIKGMSCDHCANRVETAINELPGIQKTKIHLKKGQGVVKFDEAQVSANEIAEKVSAIGYETTID